MRYIKYILTILTYFLVLYGSFSFAKVNISDREVDVGKIIQGNPINYIFVIKNMGDKPVNIMSIVPD